MRFRIVGPTFAAALGLALTGCATIFAGTSDTITFDSEPAGAMVVIDGVDRGRTPLTTTVTRDVNSRDITYRLEGYETRTFELGQEFEMIAILDLFCFPLCPVVDLLTGAVMEYDPSSYRLELTARDELEAALDVDEVVFVDELELDASGLPSTDQIRPDVALVNSTTRKIVVLR